LIEFAEAIARLVPNKKKFKSAKLTDERIQKIKIYVERLS
jgi:hypothetical protein